jgi:hypothetical protein
VKILLTVCTNVLGGASLSVSAIAKDFLETTIVAMRGRPEFNLLLVRLAREEAFSIRGFIHWFRHAFGELWTMFKQNRE